MSREMADLDNKPLPKQEGEAKSLKEKNISCHSFSQQRSEHQTVQCAEREEDEIKTDEENDGVPENGRSEHQFLQSAEEEEDKRKLEEEEEGGFHCDDGVHTAFKQRPPYSDELNQMDLSKTERSVDAMQDVEKEHKNALREKFKCIRERTAADRSHLERIYTKLLITRRVSLWDQQSLCEFLHETNHHAVNYSDKEISAHDIFTPQPGEQRPIKTVLMKGIAGIGKTVAVQKFSLDWAEGKHNQHIGFIFVLPFRELNLIKDAQFSLLGLLTYFHPALKQIQDTQKLVDKQILLIFDGLDESRFQLHFKDNKRVSDLTKTSSVDTLLTNLIMGSLLPSALIWITSRPAAANQIPPEYIDRMSEVQGFTDQQKEEFFERKFPDDRKGTISSIKKMISFFFMCHIPIFCWITAEVFENRGSQQKSEGITTVTELYIHYLLIQAQRAVKRYEEHSPHDKDTKNIVESRTFKMFLKLGQLAYEQMKQNNIIFYDEDLRKCGLDVNEASVFCGLCSEILKQEYGLYERKMFSFVHLSFQEFLAALYVFHCCVNKKMTAVRSLVGDISAELPQHELMKRVVKKALQSKNGHLDLFLCFFLGMSLESSQTLLQGSLTKRESSDETVEEMRRYLRKPDLEEITPEGQMNLFLCQYEMKVHTVQNDIKTFIESGVSLSPISQSVLSSMLLMSEEVLEEIDLTKGCNKGMTLERLLPALKNCRRAILHIVVVHGEGSETLSSVLKSADSSLRELHLTGGIGVSYEPLLSLLFDALRSPDCKLETLGLELIALIRAGGATLSSVLQSAECSVKELHLRDNLWHFYDKDLLNSQFAALSSPGLKLETLRLTGVSLHREGCELLASGLKSADCHLRELDLLNCQLGQCFLNEDDDDDGGLLDVIPTALQVPLCHLEIFRMRGCHLTETCCEVFAKALGSNSHLRELDLSQNDLRDVGVNSLSAGLSSPLCRLEVLRLSMCRVTEKACSSLGSALTSNPSHLRELDLSYNHPGCRGVQFLSQRLEDPNCSLEKLNVDHEKKCWGETTQLKNDAWDLTLDPQTASPDLHLSEGKTQSAWRREAHRYSKHPESMDFRGKVLCSEGLTGCCYWEVEWEGMVSVGVTYKTICVENDTVFQNDKSWCFLHTGYSYSVRHNNVQTYLPVPLHRDPTHPELSSWKLPQRIGVYLDWPAGLLSFYRVYSDTVIHLHTFHATFTAPLYPAFQCDEKSSFVLFGRQELKTAFQRTLFTPDVLTESTNTIYRLQCSGPGVFQCRLTRLQFGMEGEGEVLYQTVQWDESLLQSAGRVPAGPLFSIECRRGSVCQLHLSHCETLPERPPEGLSVAHITDEGASLLEPLEMTSSHVVVNVTHLSSFGLVWLLERFLFSPRPISGQVLLFLRPLSRRRRQILNVFLLPANVLFPEVRRQHDEDEFIKTSADCDLTPGQCYSLSCPPDRFTQPEEVQFGLRYGPNYHPTFEVFLDAGTESVTLKLQGSNKTVWQRQVDLTVTGQNQSVDRPSLPSPFPKVSIQRRLLAVLKKLTDPQLSEFQWHLTVGVSEDFPPVLHSEVENVDRLRTVDTVVQRYGAEGAVRITLQVLGEMQRNDLLEDLEPSS